MEYTVGFLFSPDGSKVLLQRKLKTEYAGLFNGVGGKLEEGETPEQCMIREIAEETGIVQLWGFRKVCTLILPHDCGTGKDETCTLHFFCAKTREEYLVHSDNPQVEECQWWSTGNVIRVPIGTEILAGTGDVQYVVHNAHNLLLHVEVDDNGV